MATYTKDDKGTNGTTNATYQALQVLPVFATETAIRLPYPVPAGGVSTTSSEENYSVVGFH